MYSLQPIDYTIIIGFLLITVVVGFIMTKKASSNLENYFLAGRSIPWYLLGIAGMSSWFDMAGTMLITSFLFMLGPRGLFIEFRGGAALILAFLLCYAGKWHRRSGCMTGAEWMTYRFGDGKSAEFVRVMTAAIGIILTIGMIAYIARGTSLFMGMLFPFPPTECAAVLIGITALYTMSAGFYAVVFTDLVQGTLVMLSAILVGFLAWHSIPSSANLAEAAMHVTGNSQWTHSLPVWHTSMPEGYQAYESLIMFALFYLLRNILGGMGSGAEPRYFAAKNDRECGLQSLLQGVTVMLRWPMMIGFAVMGIYLVQRMYPDLGVVSHAATLIHSYFPSVGANTWHDVTSKIALNPSSYPPELIAGLKSILGADWTTRLQLVGYYNTVNPERILPAVLMYAVPTGLKGVLIVSLIAAMKSTFGMQINTGSAFFVKDIYQNLFRPNASNRELISVSYVSSLAIVATGFVMGIAAANINDLWAWIVMGLTAGCIAPNLLRLYWWRCNAWGMAAGGILGGVGAIAQRIFAPQMVEWHQFIIMTGVSFLGTIVLSLVTPATPMDKLIHFYRTTRPFGWWGPVRAHFDKAEQRELTKEHKSDIIAVPFVLVWQVTLFLLPMQLIIKSYSSFWMTLPLFLVGVIGMYFYWWRNLPPADETATRVVEKEDTAVVV